MKLKRIISGILAVGIIACSALAPDAPLSGGIVIEAEAASSKPAAPTGVKVTSTSVGTVKISWDKVKNADGVTIYRATSKNGKYKSYASVNSKKTSIKFNDLKEDKTYYFKLRAYKKSSGKKVYSDYTSVKKVTVLSTAAKNLETAKKKTPLYAKYMEIMSMGYPLYMDIEFSISGEFETFTGETFNMADFNNGSLGQITRMAIGIKSSKKAAFKYYYGSGQTASAIIDGNDFYVLIPDYKYAVRMPMKKSEREKLLGDLESLTGGMQSFEMPDVDFDALKVKTQNVKFDGKDCVCEKITIDMRGFEKFEMSIYADAKTKEIKCVKMKDTDYDVYMKFHELSNDPPASMFKIPSDYTLIDGSMLGM